MSPLFYNGVESHGIANILIMLSELTITRLGGVDLWVSSRRIARSLAYYCVLILFKLKKLV